MRIKLLDTFSWFSSNRSFNRHVFDGDVYSSSSTRMQLPLAIRVAITWKHLPPLCNKHAWAGNMQELAEAGLFGRALPANEQVFVIVADSVIRQLDGLKADPNLSRAIRRFLGKGLDAYGPAGDVPITQSMCGWRRGGNACIVHVPACSMSFEVHHQCLVCSLYCDCVVRGCKRNEGTRQYAFSWAK